MAPNQESKVIAALSSPLVVMLVVVSCVGLFLPSFYHRETANWTVQAKGQDAIDLFLLTPILVVASILAMRKNAVGFMVWSGAMFYLIYTFVIYSFAVHFNFMFVPYCLILGLSFYSFLYFIFSRLNKENEYWVPTGNVAAIVGTYFIIIAVVFYSLWLAQIVPAALINITPKDLDETGVPVNPIHALDLSVCLPAFLITGISLMRRKAFAYLLAPVLLVFSGLMDLTIVYLIVVMKMNGVRSDSSPAILIAFLALFSTVLFVMCARSARVDPSKRN